MFTIKVENYNENGKLEGHTVFETDYYSTKRHDDGRCELVYVSTVDKRQVTLEVTTRVFVENSRGHTMDMIAPRKANGGKK